MDIAVLAKQLTPIEWLKDFAQETGKRSDDIEQILKKLERAQIISMGVLCMRSPVELNNFGINSEDIGFIRYALRTLDFSVREPRQDTDNLPLVHNENIQTKIVSAPTTPSSDFSTPVP